MTKLSPAQLAILRRAQENPITVWDKGVRMQTIWALQGADLIAERPPFRSGVYIITPAGRAYLEGLE